MTPTPPTTGAIRVLSNPYPASVYLGENETYVGVTGSNGLLIPNLIPGTYKVTVRYALYYDWVGSVTFTAGQTVDVTADLQAITTGTLDIDSTPRGADIWIDDADLGALTPQVFTDMTPGLHHIKLTAPGYLDWRIDVTIQAGQTSTINAVMDLEPTPMKGTLTVTSVPSGAQVMVDNVIIGVTPLSIEKDPGNYTVVISLTGYKAVTVIAIVAAGQVTPVSTTLEISTPTNTGLYIGATILIGIILASSRRG
jgi:hypothetical protein